MARNGIIESEIPAKRYKPIKVFSFMLTNALLLKGSGN
jgi:hypothetical protein